MDREIANSLLEALKQTGESSATSLYLEIAIVILIILFGAYLREKGKQVAKLEHIEKLSTIVEDIKQNNKQEFEKIAQENRMALSAFQQINDLRLAALDKRLEVHQEAYSLWDRLIKNIHRESELRSALNDCEKLWIEKSLYLTKESRQAFSEAMTAASIHGQLKLDKDADKIIENHAIIRKAGIILVSSVSLPGLKRDDHVV